jgi:hypothetical protein
MEQSRVSGMMRDGGLVHRERARRKKKKGKDQDAKY